MFNNICVHDSVIQHGLFTVHLAKVTFKKDFLAWKKGEFVYELWVNFYTGEIKSHEQGKDKTACFTELI